MDPLAMSSLSQQQSKTNGKYSDTKYTENFKSSGNSPTTGSCKTKIHRRGRASPYGGDNNFPISTFSIEDTLQVSQNQSLNGHGEQQQKSVHKPGSIRPGPDSGSGDSTASSMTSSVLSGGSGDDFSGLKHSTWNGSNNSNFGGNPLSKDYNWNNGKYSNGNGIHCNGNSPNKMNDLHRDDHLGNSNSLGSHGMGHFGSTLNGQHERQRHNGANEPFDQGLREIGIIDKLLHSYGFIQCCDRQSRLFFHYSQFEGIIEHLKMGDSVEFEMTQDRRTGKPIASFVTKIGPEIVLSSERVMGTVTTGIHYERNGERQGRISFENRGECFFLPYSQEDVEGNVTLCTGDHVSFQIATNHRTGNLTVGFVRLENSAQPVRYKGIVSFVSIKENFGLIERGDVAKEMYFHFSEMRGHESIVVGDNVEFNIQTQNGKEIGSYITKLPYGTVVLEDIGAEIIKGQMLKPIDKSQLNPGTPRSEIMQGRLRYRGPERQEVEVVFGEKDQKGYFTMRHGDWVEFQLAVDRRDKQQRATNITLLEESFGISGERREQGIISDIKDGNNYGYISCAERDFNVFFRTNELLNYNRPPKIGDDVEFIIVPDPQSPVRQSAIRIKYLAAGTVQFEIPVSKDIVGLVIREPSTSWVSEEALAGILPSLANLGLPQTVTDHLIQGLSSAEIIRQLNQEQHGEPGIISYCYEPDWQPQTITFHWKDCNDLKNIRVGAQVCFDIHKVRRNRELMSANVRAMEVIENEKENCVPFDMDEMDKILREIQCQQIDALLLDSPSPTDQLQQQQWI